jgi:putative FmdB family regulatory protein
MPTYVFECIKCESDLFERNVAIADRNKQCCRSCGRKLERHIVFNGLTWAPTAGGMR